MKLSLAKQLLRLMQDNADPARPLKEQLGNLFVPSFWSEQLYLRSSFMGKVTTFFELPWERQTSLRKVTETFRDALQTLIDKREEKDGVKKFTFRVADLYRDLTATKTERVKETTPIPGIEELERKKTEKCKKEEETKPTLFNTKDLSTVEEVSLETFQTIFNEEASFEEKLKLLETFLDKHPFLATPHYKEKIASLREASTTDKKNLETLVEEPSKRQERLGQISREMCTSVKGLPSKGKKMVFFSYGNPHITIQSLLENLRRLPFEKIKQLPSALTQFLNDDELGKPEKLAEKLIQACFKVADKAKAHVQVPDVPIKEYASPLFVSSLRRVPEPIAQALPLFFEKHLEMILQEGLLGNGANYLDMPEVSPLIHWIAENGLSLLDDNLKEEAEKKLQEKLITFTQKKFESHYKSVQNLLETQLSRLQEVIPQEIIELTGIDALLLSGPLWMEFENQGQGIFGVNIYSIGPALHHHPQNNDGHPYSVLRLKDIEEKKLSTDFFLTLLNRHYEPYWNETACPKVGDIYAGPVELLQGKVAPNLPEDQPVVKKAPVDSWQLTLNLLLAPPKTTSPLLEMYVEAIVSFCKPFIKEKKLHLPSEETCVALEKALLRLKKEVEEKDLEAIPHLNETLNEIEQAIHQFRFKSSSEKWGLDLSHRGPSLEFLETTKAVAESLFGKEAAEFFDAVIGDYKHKAPTTATAPSPTSPEPTLALPKAAALIFNSYSSMYLHIAWKLTQLVSTAIALYYGGIYHLLNIPYLLSIFPLVLPPSILYWYNKVMMVVKVQLGRLAAFVLWNLFLPEKSKNYFNQIAEKVNGKISEAKKILTQESSVSFAIEPVPAPAKASAPAHPMEQNTLLQPAYFWVDARQNKSQEVFGTVPAMSAMLSASRSSPTNLTMLLDSLKSDSNNISYYFPLFEWEFLLDQLIKLETPSSTSQSVWASCDSPLEAMETLSAIAHCCLKKKSLFNFSRTSFMVAMYKILAIQTCLARQCRDAHLKNYAIDISPLVEFYLTTPIENPELVAQIEAIISYLLPEFHFDTHFKDRAALLELYKKGLFFYPGLITLEYFLSDPDENYDDKCLSKRETDYLLERAKEPAMQEKIRALGIKNPLPPREIMLLLFQESIVFNREKPLVPRAFQLLKKQVLYCRDFYKDPTWKFRDEEVPLPTYDASITTTEEVPTLFFEYTDTVVDHSYLSSFANLAEPFRCAFNNSVKKTEAPTRTEPQTLKCLGGWPRHVQLTYVEFSERLIQMASECKEFGPEKVFAYARSWLPFLAFSAGALKRHLEKSPQSVKAFVELFEELLPYCLQRLKSMLKDGDTIETMQLCLDIFELGISIRHYCEYFLPGSFRLFPDIRAYCQALKPFFNDFEKANKQEKAKALIFQSYGYPDEIDSEEEKLLMMAECLACLFKNELTLSKLDPYFFQRWLQEAYKELLSERRSLLLNTFVKMQNWEKVPTDKKWVTGRPLFYTNGVVTLNFSTGVVRRPITLDFWRSALDVKYLQTYLEDTSYEKTTNKNYLPHMLEYFPITDPNRISLAKEAMNFGFHMAGLDLPTRSAQDILINNIRSSKCFARFVEPDSWEYIEPGHLASGDYSLTYTFTDDVQGICKLHRNVNGRRFTLCKLELEKEEINYDSLAFAPSWDHLWYWKTETEGKISSILVHGEKDHSSLIEILCTEANPHPLVRRRLQVSKYLEYEGTTYHDVFYCSAGEHFPLSLLSKVGAESLSEVLLWQAGTKVLIQNKSDLTKAIVVDESDISKARRQQNPPGEEVVLELPEGIYGPPLQPLARFCPISKIKVTAKADTASMSTLHLGPQDLKFTVHNREGALVAEAEKFPGFFLAKKQFHPALRGFSSFLLLENSGGKYKVLISDRQWVQTFLSRFTRSTGYFELYLQNKIGERKEGHTSSYTVFDIIESDSTTSPLQSDDPVALAYLLTLYMCQGQVALSESICRQVEWLCRSQKVSDNLFDTLSLLAIAPIEMEGISYIRQRLFSAYEQNRLLFPREEKEVTEKEDHLLEEEMVTGQESTLAIKDLIVLAVLVNDLNDIVKNSNPRYPLSSNQEYFLFSCVFHILSRLLKKHIPLPATLGIDYLEEVGFEYVIEAMNLFPHLTSRFQKLKLEAGIQESWAVWKFKKALQFIFTPSTLPPLMGNGSTFFASNTFTSVKGMKSALIHFSSLSRDILFSGIKSVHPPSLHREMVPSIDADAVLDLDKFSSEHIKKWYVTYYAIAKGDLPARREELAALLKLHKGVGDKQANILMFYLEVVMAYPTMFLSTNSLLLAHKNYREKQVGGYWDLFLTDLNNKAFRTYLSHQFIDPLVQQVVLMTTAEPLISSVISKLLPPQLLLNYASSHIAATVARAGYIETYGKWAKTLKPAVMERLPGAGDYVIKRGKISRWDLVKLGGKWALTAAAVYGVSYSVNLALQGYEGVLCAITSPLLPAATCLAARTSQLSMEGSFIPTLLAGGINYLIAKKYNIPIAWRHILPGGLVGEQALHLGSKGINFLKRNLQQLVAAEKPHERKAPATIDYSPLVVVDKMGDDFLDMIFDLAFIEEEDKSQEMTVALVPHKEGDSPIVKEKIDKVNGSIQAFYQTRKRASLFTLQKEDALPEVYMLLQNFATKWKAHLDEEREKLLSLFNTNPQGQPVGSRPLELVDLCSCVERGTLGKIGKEAGLTDEVLPALQLVLARLYLKISRLRQMEKVLETFKAISSIVDRRSLAYFKHVEQLAIGLKTRTAFDLTTTPARLIWLNLCFEQGTGTRLRERQVRNRIKALDPTKGSVVTEEPPGDGKTFYGIPITAAHEATGDKLVIPMAPKQLAGDNQPKISQQLRTIFNITSHALTFKREIKLRRENLEALLILLMNARREGEVPQTTKEDAQTLRSLLDDVLYKYFHTNSSSKFYKNSAILLHKILKLIRTSGVAIPDEAHETYRNRDLLNFTVGSFKTISEDLFRVAERTMRIITRDEELFTLIKDNKLYKIDREHYRKVILPRLAKLLRRDPRFELKTNQKKEFFDFVTDLETAPPAWLTEDEQRHDEWSLVRGILNILLPVNFVNRTYVDYMASKKGNGEYARPGEGNSSVSEQSVIQSPYESHIKTFLMLLTQGLTLEQFSSLLTTLTLQAKKEITKTGIPYERTKVYKKFGEVRIEKLTVKGKRLLYEKWNHDPDACLIYARYHIRDTIRYWTKYIANTSQDYASLCHKQISCTGTPYNDGTYPAWMEMLNDPTTIGELLHIIKQRCPADGLHVIKAKAPREVLDLILNKFFLPGSSFSAIIDGGAKFTGMSNEEVACLIMEHCLAKWPMIKAVKFYKENPQGKEQVYCFVAGMKDPQPIEAVKIEDNLCLTYYDQRHGFGADIHQWGDGQETMGPNHPLYRWLQELFRIRPLKLQPRLKAIQDLLISMPVRKINICLTEEDLPMICPDGNLSLEGIVEYGVRSEAAIAEEEHYPAQLRKVYTTTKYTIEDKVFEKDSDDFASWSAIWEEFEGTFITTMEDAPRKLFGMKKTDKTPKTALEEACDKSLRTIQESYTFSKKEKEELKKELLSLKAPALPSSVSVWQNGDGSTVADLSDGLGSTAVIEAQDESEQDNKQEVQTQLNLQNNLQAHQSVDFFSYRYHEWENRGIQDPTALDWLEFSDPVFEVRPTANYTFLGLKKQDKCPLFRVQDLMKVAEAEVIKEAALLFDRRLWMSNNFVPRKMGYATDAAFTDVGGRGQFFLIEALVHLKEVNGKWEVVHMAPLSVRDSAFFRSKLNREEDFWKEKPIKTVLWDIHTRTVQAGFPIDQNLLRQHFDFNVLIFQLKLLDACLKYASEKPFIMEWLKTIPVETVRKAFEVIHAARGKGPYQGSEIYNIFIEATPERPYEEDI